MKVFTFSQARQNFASVLDRADEEGSVCITRRDGRSFTIQPARATSSPLAVRQVRTHVTRRDILEAVRESREQKPRR